MPGAEKWVLLSNRVLWVAQGWEREDVAVLSLQPPPAFQAHPWPWPSEGMGTDSLSVLVGKFSKTWCQVYKAHMVCVVCDLP